MNHLSINFYIMYLYIVGHQPHRVSPPGLDFCPAAKKIIRTVQFMYVKFQNQSCAVTTVTINIF